MAIEKNKKQERGPVFSKEVDSTITGFALGLGFLGIGVFLVHIDINCILR